MTKMVAVMIKEHCARVGSPTRLEDVGVHVVLNDEAAANQLIDRTTDTRNPFDPRYSNVGDADWGTFAAVLNRLSMKEMLSEGW